MKKEYVDETTFEKTDVEIDDHMYDQAMKIMLATGDTISPMMCDKTGTKLFFGINKGVDSRLEKEIGNKMYKVTIEKIG